MKIRKFCFFLVILCYLTEKCVIFLSNNALKKKKKSPMLQCWNSNRTISPIFPPTLKKKKKICSHGNAALS